MEYQDSQSSLWFTETFSTPLQPLNGIPQNLTGSKFATPSTKFLFLGRLENYDGRHASDLLRIFRLLVWNRWMEFNKSWQEASTQRPPPNLCFSGRSLSAYMHVSFQEKILRYTIVDLWASCFIKMCKQIWSMAMSIFNLLYSEDFETLDN